MGESNLISPDLSMAWSDLSDRVGRSNVGFLIRESILISLDLSMAWSDLSDRVEWDSFRGIQSDITLLISLWLGLISPTGSWSVSRAAGVTLRPLSLPARCVSVTKEADAETKQKCQGQTC